MVDYYMANFSNCLSNVTKSPKLIIPSSDLAAKCSIGSSATASSTPPLSPLLCLSRSILPVPYLNGNASTEQGKSNTIMGRNGAKNFYVVNSFHKRDLRNGHVLSDDEGYVGSQEESPTNANPNSDVDNHQMFSRPVKLAQPNKDYINNLNHRRINPDNVTPVIVNSESQLTSSTDSVRNGVDKNVANHQITNRRPHSLSYSAGSSNSICDPLKDKKTRKSKFKGHLTLSVSHYSCPVSDPTQSSPCQDEVTATRILKFLFLGSESDSINEDLLDRLNIAFVINVTANLPNVFEHKRKDIKYFRIPVDDSSKEDISKHFDDAFQFIELARLSGKGCLVHCQAGISRSTTIVVSYLMRHNEHSFDEAYKYVKKMRPIVSPNISFVGALKMYEDAINSSQ